MKPKFKGGHLPIFEFELDGTESTTKSSKTAKRQGSVDEVLGIPRGALKKIIEKKLIEYIHTEYLSAGVLTDNCRTAIPIAGNIPNPHNYLVGLYSDLKFKGIIKTKDYHSTANEQALNFVCASCADSITKEIAEECNEGISKERKGQLEKCLEILEGSTILSGVRW